MKVMVTGSNGMLGTDLCEIFKNNDFEVIPMTQNDFDITNLNQTIEKIKEYNPDVVIHPAAYTNVDACEENIDLAYQINSIGARNVALACKEIDAAMVYISTDYVFDGTSSTPYKEFDVASPQSIYGKSKLAGENYVRDILSKYYIVRTAWLYGKNGKNFVITMIDLASKMPQLKVVNDQNGCPTYTKDLSEAIAQLIKKPAYGVYHLSNSEPTTWYGFTQEIFIQCGIGTPVVPCTTDEFPRPAKRPAYSVLDNCSWRLEGFMPLRPWQEALTDYLKEIGKVNE